MWLKVDFIWQPMKTSAVVGWKRRAKASPKAKLAPTKAHAHCLVVCCPIDPLQLSQSWWNCCRKGDPFKGPKLGSCLTLRDELSEETHVLTKQEILLGKGPRGGEQEGKGTQENCSAAWLTVSGFMVMGLVSGLSLANHSNSVFPGGARITQPRWMLARGILGSGRTRCVFFWPFPNSSGWWWLSCIVLFSPFFWIFSMLLFKWYQM